MQPSFKNIFTVEVLKTKSTHILPASILLPFIITAFSAAANIQLFFGGTAEVGENPWRSLCLLLFDNYKFLYPILIIVICFKLDELEQQPIDPEIPFIQSRSKTYSYYSKAFILIFCLFISLLIGLSLIFISGKLCSIYYPLMHFQDYEITDLMIPFFEKLLFYGLSLIAIQLFLNNCFKNVIYSVGIPLLLIILGNAFLYSDYNYLFPYTYSFQAALDFENSEGFVIHKIFYWSILYSVLFFALGASVVRLQKIHRR